MDVHTINTDAELHHATQTIIPDNDITLRVPVEVIRQYLVLKQQKNRRLKQAKRVDMKTVTCRYNPLKKANLWEVKFTRMAWKKFASSPCFQPVAPTEPTPVFTPNDDVLEETVEELHFESAGVFGLDDEELKEAIEEFDAIFSSNHPFMESDLIPQDIRNATDDYLTSGEGLLLLQNPANSMVNANENVAHNFH